MKQTQNKLIILIFVLFFYNTNFISAQIVLNGDFEEFIFTGGDCECNIDLYFLTTATAPFQGCGNPTTSFPNCWWVSHGTPEIFRYQGNNEAVLWSGKWENEDAIARGEGLFIYCNFHENRVYNLSLKLGSGATAIDHVYIELVTGGALQSLTSASYNVYDGSYDIPIVATEYKQTIKHYTNFSAGQTTINISFIPDNDYHCLWIYPIHNSHPISVLYMDNVSIAYCETYEIYLNISNLPVLTARSDYIKTTGIVKVLNGQNVTFTAGNYIELNPGFETQPGCFFDAYIGGCSQLTCAQWNTKKKLLPISDKDIRITHYPNYTKEGKWDR